MYAILERRTMNSATAGQTSQRADSSITPVLRRAPGFVANYVFMAQEDGRTVAHALYIWESREQAEACRDEMARWADTLDQLGHRRESEVAGPVTYHIAPEPSA